MNRILSKFAPVCVVRGILLLAMYQLMDWRIHDGYA